MYIINKIFYFFGILLLAGCAGKSTGPSTGQTDLAGAMPVQLQYGTFADDLYGTRDDEHKIAVLLPMSGQSAQIGRAIAPGIESAILKHGTPNLGVKFYDTAAGDFNETISKILDYNPDVVIGPVFADDARALRNQKSSSLPVMSFTSDLSAVGDNVFSISLLPGNSIESIVSEMLSNNTSKFIVIAPNTTSGHIMAGAAKTIGNTYNLDNIGIFYYDESDTESIKNTSMNAAMYTPRNAANTRAKEVLANILNHENLTPNERSSLSGQLTRIGRTDTLGKIPYDSILFLGTPNDTKSIASFLRYYGIGANDVQFYGTALWADGDISDDIIMSGARYASLPEIPTEFSNMYESATGINASRLATIGYDATILAIDALYSNQDISSYITNPNGYIGINGLFRILRNGTNERAMEIVKINGDGTTTPIRTSSKTFMTPIYKVNLLSVSPADEKSLTGYGINIYDYIKIPDRFKSKYRSKTFSVSAQKTTSSNLPEAVLLPVTENEFSITPTEYVSNKKESVNKTYIDSVELSE